MKWKLFEDEKAPEAAADFTDDEDYGAMAKNKNAMKIPEQILDEESHGSMVPTPVASEIEEVVKFLPCGIRGQPLTYINTKMIKMQYRKQWTGTTLLMWRNKLN